MSSSEVILILGLVWKSSNYITSNQDIDRRSYVIGILLLLLAYLVQGIGNDNMIANQVLLYPLLAIAMSITNNGYTQEIVEGMELFRQ